MTNRAVAVEKSKLEGNHGCDETIWRQREGEEGWERGALDET